MERKKINLCLAKLSGLEQKYIQEALEMNWVAPLGPNVDAFETELEEYLGENKFVTALSSGTAALHLSLVLSDVKAGDEVICQSWTFAASANPIVYQGAKPIFVDSEDKTWNMSPDLLEDAIKDCINRSKNKPKAIIVAEMYGMPAMWDEIMAISRRYDIPVIEDSAEAMGSKYRGKKCGTIGDFGILSFNGNKMITTSGGGALISNTEVIKKVAMFYATQAREPFPYYQHEKIGYNYRMSNICAGIGRGQMHILEENLAHHRRLAKFYADSFEDLEEISVHLNPTKDYDSNYWLTTIVLDRYKTRLVPEEIRQQLAKENIESRPLWKPMHLQPVYSQAKCFLSGVSGDLFPRGLCLPSGPHVSLDDAAYIVEIIKRCFDNVAFSEKFFI